MSLTKRALEAYLARLRRDPVGQADAEEEWRHYPRLEPDEWRAFGERLGPVRHPRREVRRSATKRSP